MARPTVLIVLLAGAAAAATAAEPPAPPPTSTPQASAAAFSPQWAALVGTWTGEGEGRPGSGGGTATFQFDLERHVLIRRSSSDYPASQGRPAVHHEDLLVIHPDGASPDMRAIYFDNEGHVIEYAASWSADGQLLTFTSSSRPETPTFRLTYRWLGSDRMSVSFEIAPPASTAFTTYVSGIVRRSGGS